DVSPRQMVSVATAMIPFLEHDDANRALMGSNMQRQSVPLLRSEAPLVGTGQEYRAAKDAGDVIVAVKAGVVSEVSADYIHVMEDDGGYTTYRVAKFRRSNQGTCFNQKPIVAEGARVEAGQVIADGPCTDEGEMALGKNLLVAFMPWEGHNYEDAIILSQRLVQDDVLSSIHIEEHEVDARDTKLGPEEITRDIPNVSDEVLADLDDRGIIRIGAEVVTGDILAGRHGNKGVIAKILPIEDMPFLEDGTPVDIVLNPLGVPGRMNVGQVLETHLGWVAKSGWEVNGADADWKKRLRKRGAETAEPGTPVATPVFD